MPLCQGPAGRAALPSRAGVSRRVCPTHHFLRPFTWLTCETSSQLSNEFIPMIAQSGESCFLGLINEQDANCRQVAAGS